MKRNSKGKLIIYLTILIIFIYSIIGPKGELVENLEIPIGIGYDLEGKTEKEVSYGVPISIYIFEEPGISSTVLSGTGTSIGETRETRQIKSSKKFLLGLERILILSERASAYGIRPVLDILVNNPEINDRAPVAVCKGKAEDILKRPVKGFANSAEYLEGLVDSSSQFNFFPKRQFTLLDMIVRVDAEGRNVVLPYIEIKGENIEITGLALFNGDKMVAKTNLEEARIINLLKFNDVTGILTIQENSKEYINYSPKSKRKIKCSKEGEKFKFTIDLNLNGSIASNTLYKNLNSDPKVLKKFTTDMEKSVKEMCENFVNNKIKGEYKTDVLGLGRVAAAKYGRKTGTDWNKVISESIIEVNVKVKVDTEGRGSYQKNKSK